MIKITIITVVFNDVNEIEKTIKSVLNQTDAEIEYIVVDGGSSDGTVEVIKQYEKGITRFLSEPDDGIYHAMNKGLMLATGDYVYFLNSGDCLFKGILKRISLILENNDIDLLYGNIIHQIRGRVQPAPIEAIHWMMPMCHQSIFLRRSIVDKFDTDYRFGADYKLIYGLYKENYSFLYAPIDVAFFKNGGSGKFPIDCCYEQTDISCRLIDYDDKYFDVYRESIIDTYLNDMFGAIINGYGLTFDYRDYATEYLKKYNKIIVWGVGDIAVKHKQIIEDIKESIDYFVDIDMTKCGGTFQGIKIKSVDSVKNEKNKCVFVLNEKNCYAIKNELEKMKLDETMQIDDYIKMKELFIEKNREKMIYEGLVEISSFGKLFRTRD